MSRAVHRRPRGPRPGAPVRAHRTLLAVLHSPAGRMLGGLCELRFVGRVSGRDIALPVQCVREGNRLVVRVGRAEGKRWWRNFRGGHDVRVRVGGVDHRGRGRIVDVGDPDRARAEQVLSRGRSSAPPAGPLLVVLLGTGTGAAR